MNRNEMSYNQLANILKQLDILDIPNQKIEDLEYQWEKLPNEVHASLDKLALLLTDIGRRYYDSKTNSWLTNSKQVYSFDMECYDMNNMYTLLLQGLKTISEKELTWDYIKEEIKIEKKESEVKTVTFHLNQQPYQIDIPMQND